MIQRHTTIVAIGIFSILVFVCALAYGLDIFLAILATVSATVVVGGTFIWLQQKFHMLNSITGITLFAIVGILFSIVLFAVDCLVIHINDSIGPLIETCMHSFGFVLTAGVSVLLGGLVVVALIRVIIDKIAIS